MGVLDARVACDSNLRRKTGRDIGGMYVGTDYGFAATVLSLATNVLATSVVAFKAWYVPWSYATLLAHPPVIDCK